MLALVTAVSLVGTAIACPEDTDGDTVCDGIDNCPADPNTDQADLDGDGTGDVCDENDAELNVTRLELKHGSLDSSNDTSLYRGKGDFLTTPPADAVTAASGLSIRVKDSLETDLTYAWAAADCLTTSAGAIRCVSLDRLAKLQVKPLKAPRTHRFTFRVKRVGIEPTRAFNPPVEVTLSQGPIDRFGPIGDCRASNRGLFCKEF
jgi:hypothetical protein